MRSLFMNDQGRLRPILGLALFMALFMASGRLLEPFIHSHPMSRVRAMNLRVLAVLACSMLCLLAERRSWRELGLRLSGRWWLQVLAGAGLGGGLVLLCALMNLALGGFHWTANPNAFPPLLIGVGIFLFFAALNEELLFRGYPFMRLVELLGFWPAQALIAVLFAVAHWSNPGMDGATKVVGSLVIGAGSLMLGAARRRADGLSIPLGLHWAWNLVQGPILGFAVSGDAHMPRLLIPVLHDRPLLITGGAFGLEATASAVLVCVAATFLLARPPRSAAEPLPLADAEAI